MAASFRKGIIIRTLRQYEASCFRRIVSHEPKKLRTTLLANNMTLQSTTPGTKDIFSPENVSFGNSSMCELLRAVVVLRMCSLPGFADNALQIMNVSRKCLGETLFSMVMRRTVYGQFVAGVDTDEIKSTANKLAQSNLLTMLAVTIEDVPFEDVTLREQVFDSNTMKILNCIDISRSIGTEGKETLMQIRLTAFTSVDLLADFTSLYDKNPFSVNKLAEWITDGCDEKSMEQILPQLSDQQRSLLSAGIKRFHRVFKHAEKNGVGILVDAEYTWINPAIRALTLAMMFVFNRDQPVVWNTFQAYLKETHEVLLQHAEECKKLRVHFAFKLVRGAYLMAESKRAGGHPKYVCDDWNMTNNKYNQCLSDCFRLDPEMTQFMVASHNETSVRLAIKLLQAGSQKWAGNVAFGQVYGMADYMSHTLGLEGYTVYRSVPYGTIDESLLYLCRRAKENTLFLSGIRKEREMLRMALGQHIRRVLTRKKIDT